MLDRVKQRPAPPTRTGGRCSSSPPPSRGLGAIAVPRGTWPVSPTPGPKTDRPPA